MKKIIIILNLIIATLLITGCSKELEYKSQQSYLGINLSGVSDYSSEFPFKDIFKMSRNWRTDSSANVTFITDENGWVTDLNGNAHAVAFLSSKYIPLGKYVLTYEGEGEIDITGGSVSNKVKEEGKITFDITEYGKANTRVIIKSINKDNYIKNIQIIEDKYVDTMDDIFHPVFLKNISMFHDIRFMDFMKTNGSEIETWDDRPKLTDHSWGIKGVPLEVMVELCNQIKANPWFCMPHMAQDEYINNFSKYVNENLDDNLTVYLENSNEVWNGIFAAQKYYVEQGKKHPFISNDNENWKIAQEYYALRSVEIFKIWDQNYNNDLVKILSAQSANYGIGTTIMKFVLPDGTLASEHADALAIAPYIGDSKKVDHTNQSLIFKHLEEEMYGDYIKDITNNYENATKYGLELICYEAGQHLADQNNAEKTTAFIQANRDKRMGTIYKKYLDIWKDEIGTKMFLFNSVGVPGNHGSWSLLEYQNQPYKEAYKYTEVKNWISKNKKKV